MENELHEVLERIYKSKQREFIPGRTKISIGRPTYGISEINRVVSTMLDGWITMGKEVFQFEDTFAKSIGSSYAVSTNSGSSANLIAMKSLNSPLSSKKVSNGSCVITSALNYPTTVSSISDAGLKPLLVDVDPETLNIDIESLKSALSDKVSSVFLVHLLGNPCEMKEIMKLCDEKGICVLEDVAEAQGAEYGSKKCGSFGLASTFSFFGSHIMTTGEGGMVVTDNEEFADIARTIRAFGRSCNCQKCTQILDPDKGCKLRKSDSELKNFDKRFVYISPGYSLKMTEMQGAFGIEQLKRINKFTDKRISNARFYTKKLSKYSQLIRFQKPTEGGKHVYFGFPIVVEEGAPFTRNQLTDFLEENNIENRPLLSGNITKQPFMKFINHEVHGDLKNSDFLMENGFFIGTHPGINHKMLKYVTDKIETFLDGFV